MTGRENPLATEAFDGLVRVISQAVVAELRPLLKNDDGRQTAAKSDHLLTAAEVASRLNVVLFDFSEGRVLGRWDPFEERFVQAEGQ